jgi:hypothetical protein
MAIGEKSALVVIGEETASVRLTRREMVRRLLAGVGAGVAWPMVAASHPIHKHLISGAIFDVQDPLPIVDWKPISLNQFEDRRLVVLADRIVPGSEKAKVNRFIDLLLSVDNEKHQREFVDALAAFEAESGKRFGKHLTALDGAQVDEILTDASLNKVVGQVTSGEHEENDLHAHFENLKGWISGAYYSSEAGMRELGWTGDYAFERFPGCEHTEGHH